MGFGDASQERCPKAQATRSPWWSAVLPLWGCRGPLLVGYRDTPCPQGPPGAEGHRAPAVPPVSPGMSPCPCQQRPVLAAERALYLGMRRRARAGCRLRPWHSPASPCPPRRWHHPRRHCPAGHLHPLTRGCRVCATGELGTTGLYCPLLTDGDPPPETPHTPWGSTSADPAPAGVGGSRGWGAWGAPSSGTHPSSRILSEPGHRAALHRAHDCHHPQSEVTRGRVLPLRCCSFMSPTAGLVPTCVPRGF